MSNLYKGKPVSGKINKKESCNENWEAEIASYDKECRRIEKKFFNKHIITSQSSNTELTEEENEVLNLFLNGISCEGIAAQYDVELDVITGVMEIIRAKLPLSDE